MTGRVAGYLAQMRSQSEDHPSTGRWAHAVVVVTSLVVCGACTISPPDDEAAQSSGTSNSSPSSSSTTSSSPSTSMASSPRSVLSQGDVDWVRVADEAETSVVSIDVRGLSQTGQGSGVVIDDNGHVLTNNHVVAPAAGGGQIQVALSDARVFDAVLVGTDSESDLAVLQIEPTPSDVTALEFGDSEAVVVGEPVMALGNPLGLSNTVTVGIVSALDRPVTTQRAGGSLGEQANPVVTNAIQTDAAVNPGNSGGALVNSSGQLIGINSSIATLGASDGGPGGSIGLGFAIPSNEAQWVARELIETGVVRHAYLGVDPEDATVTVDGVRRQAAGITKVIEGSAAAQVGLEAGEAVIEVDGETVAGEQSLVAQIREREPGTQVVLTVVRDGQSRDVTVEFGTRPDGP